MNSFIQDMLNERRSMEEALADMLADYQCNPRVPLARTIGLIRAEIELRAVSGLKESRIGDSVEA